MIEKLFEEGRIGNLRVSNRFVAQPMEGNCAGEDGKVSELALEKYKRQAAGGWGIIVVEAISMTCDSLARKHCLVLNRKNLDGFKRLVDEVKAIHPGVVLLFQITHSGSISNPAFSERVAASPLSEGRLLSSDEIERIKDGFVKCALLAEEAGADGIDYKCCHGYLGSELLRPMNIREDKWGGSWENRTRFLSEGIREIALQRRNQDFILGSRLSMYEGMRGCGGTVGCDEIVEDLSEHIQLLTLMDSLGMDYINVTAGIPAKTPMLGRPVQSSELMYLHHLRYTKTARESLNKIHSGMKVIGSAYSVLQDRAFAVAEEMLTKGYTDFVGWGRQTLADPLTPKKIMNGEAIDYCVTCSGCSKMMIKQMNVGCIMFDEHYKRYWNENR